MKTIKWNGEYWYEDRTSVLGRLANWLCWVGGTRRYGLAPISLFGHRVTFQGWGMQLRLPDGALLVVSWCGADPSRWWRSPPEAIYVSRDGTPGKAHAWLVGAPREVREEALAYAGARKPFGNWVRDRGAQETSTT